MSQVADDRGRSADGAGGPALRQPPLPGCALREAKVGEKTRNPFHIARSDAPVSTAATGGNSDDPSLPAADRVARLVESSDIFVFMKGNPQQPMCGFSANTVAMLESLGVPYDTFDVLADEAVRSAAKVHARWPTFPQVYLRGELIGGNDIVTELFTSGELAQMVEGLR